MDTPRAHAKDKFVGAGERTSQVAAHHLVVGVEQLPVFEPRRLRDGPVDGGLTAAETNPSGLDQSEGKRNGSDVFSDLPAGIERRTLL